MGMLGVLFDAIILGTSVKVIDKSMDGKLFSNKQDNKIKEYSSKEGLGLFK
jgi:3-deoxy-D-manno-octulosonate 8-phosphate phosphatase KdsC-like HAD superfamily phosphatase